MVDAKVAAMIEDLPQRRIRYTREAWAILEPYDKAAIETHVLRMNVDRAIEDLEPLDLQGAVAFVAQPPRAVD